MILVNNHFYYTILTLNKHIEEASENPLTE